MEAVQLLTSGQHLQEDLELESGEYFLAQEEKTKRKRAAEQAQQAERVAQKKLKRQEAFVPPQVPPSYYSRPAMHQLFTARQLSCLNPVLVRQRF